MRIITERGHLHRSYPIRVCFVEHQNNTNLQSEQKSNVDASDVQAAFQALGQGRGHLEQAAIPSGGPNHGGRRSALYDPHPVWRGVLPDYSTVCNIIQLILWELVGFNRKFQTNSSDIIMFMATHDWVMCLGITSHTTRHCGLDKTQCVFVTGVIAPTSMFLQHDTLQRFLRSSPHHCTLK